MASENRLLPTNRYSNLFAVTKEEVFKYYNLIASRIQNALEWYEDASSDLQRIKFQFSSDDCRKFLKFHYGRLALCLIAAQCFMESNICEAYRPVYAVSVNYNFLSYLSLFLKFSKKYHSTFTYFHFLIYLPNETSGKKYAYDFSN